jgi:hypothetical protein
MRIGAYTTVDSLKLLEARPQLLRKRSGAAHLVSNLRLLPSVLRLAFDRGAERAQRGPGLVDVAGRRGKVSNRRDRSLNSLAAGTLDFDELVPVLVRQE